MWKGLQRLCAGAHHEREYRELDSPCRRFVLEAHARLLERGDVGLVELRDVGDIYPARVQARPRDLLDPRQWASLDRAEGRKVDSWHSRQRGFVRPRRRGEELLDVRLYVVRGDPTLETGARDAREIHAELACKTPH